MKSMLRQYTYYPLTITKEGRMSIAFIIGLVAGTFFFNMWGKNYMDELLLYKGLLTGRYKAGALAGVGLCLYILKKRGRRYLVLLLVFLLVKIKWLKRRLLPLPIWTRVLFNIREGKIGLLLLILVVSIFLVIQEVEDLLVEAVLPFILVVEAPLVGEAEGVKKRCFKHLLFYKLAFFLFLLLKIHFLLLNLIF